MKVNNIDSYNKAHQMSLADSDKYWRDIAKGFSWIKEPKLIQSGNFNDLNVKWFEDGLLNITENCIDRHAAATPEKIAIHWEPNDPADDALSFTYKELLQQVNKFANVLKSKNVKKGDRVCFYMSMVPELLFGVLASARIGAIHSVVFGGFSAKALADRAIDCDSKLIVTCNEAPRGDKFIPLKSITDEACEQAKCVETVLVYNRTNTKVSMKEKRDFDLSILLSEASNECNPEPMASEDPLFILYTSGSTGQPKGLQHSTAGYMAWTSETFSKVFQYEKNDIYWCTADIGWITGHSYITYGPLLNGATQVMFEGIPTYPTPARFWEVIDKYKVTHFYTAPTAIRALEACDISNVEGASLESLKVLGTVGEPINEEAWNWYNEKIGKGKCPIVDTWWQTETGGIMISNLAGATPAIPCHATTPLPGVEAILVDSNGEVIEGNPAEGNLCIKRPWPGIARTIYGDHERYRQTYFETYKGYYFTSDGAKRDKNGNYRITGRVDDVINVSGHRIGTAEVEDAIGLHTFVIEAAVVGLPHDIKGQGIMAFIIPSSSLSLSESQLHTELNQLIVKQIGPIAKLDKIIVTEGLPKTRSGKIMRRILRKLAAGEFDTIGDTSTLLNPEIVENLKNKL
jgi:acetyl-CoA synthetase